MRILVACEESQAVCKAFRAKGHEAYSCDLIECSGGHPEWHITADVLPLLNGRCTFTTMDGVSHTVAGRWDMIIAHPPCTYLTVTGNRWFDVERYGKAAQERWLERCKAVAFFLQIAFADCPRIAIENPIGVMSTLWRKPEQVIQPYHFGHKMRKATCYWLKNLPPCGLRRSWSPKYIPTSPRTAELKRIADGEASYTEKTGQSTEARPRQASPPPWPINGDPMQS